MPAPVMDHDVPVLPDQKDEGTDDVIASNYALSRVTSAPETHRYHHPQSSPADPGRRTQRPTSTWHSSELHSHLSSPPSRPRWAPSPSNPLDTLVEAAERPEKRIRLDKKIDSTPDSTPTSTEMLERPAHPSVRIPYLRAKKGLTG